MAKTIYSVEQMGMLFEKSREAVFFMEKVRDDYQYVYINSAAYKLVEPDVISKTVGQCVLPHLAKNILHYYNLALEKKQQINFEDYTYKIKEVRKYETTVIPVVGHGKECVLAITREVAFDSDMQDKYLFMRSIFYKTSLSTVLISTDLELLEANPRFIEDFDVNIDDVHGQSFFDLPFIDIDSADLIKSYLVQAQNGLNVDSEVISFIDISGVKRLFTATFSPLTRDDDVIAVFIILQEVTKFIEQTQELRSTSHGFDMFKEAINSAADVTYTDTQGRMIDVNCRFVKNTGYTRAELIGQTHSIVNSDYHPKEFFENLWATLQRGEVWLGEVRNQKKNGEHYWVDSTIIPLMDENGKIHKYLTVQFNISEKKKLMSELRNVERTFRAITENTSDLIVVTDSNGRIIYASPSYIRKLGYTEQFIIGRHYKELLFGDSIGQWQQMLDKAGSTTVEKKMELQLLTVDGEVLWTEGNYTFIYDLDGNSVSEMIMVSREITERKELEKKLMFMAYHDSLTQLPNRSYLQKEFPHLIEAAEANFESLAVIYLDGDNFKAINDMYGHDMGDEFLKEFGRTLLKSIHHGDLVVRLGGDEFLIVATGLSRDEELLNVAIEDIVENIRKQLAIGWTIQGHQFSPTSSMGITLYPEHSVVLEELIDLADRALYEAKQVSKNSYKINKVKKVKQ